MAEAYILVFMDADDCQHNPEDIKRLLEKMDQGFDMTIGDRSASSQASVGRLYTNSFYIWFATLMVEQRAEDLTSSFRIVGVEYFRKFLHLILNGFSYPTIPA